MVSCDIGNMGCNGGWMSAAWDYLKTTGAVSDGCFPYTSGGGIAPPCQSSCDDGSVYKKYKVKKSTNI